MTMMASQITSLTVVYSTVYSDADQRKHQSSASLVFVWGIHRDRWIPRTKGQLRGKCFHLMTSSCLAPFLWIQNLVYFSFWCDWNMVLYRIVTAPHCIILSRDWYYYYLRHGEGYVFIVVRCFVCLSVCLLATLRKKGWTDFHEIFRVGGTWYKLIIRNIVRIFYWTAWTQEFFPTLRRNPCLVAALQENSWTDFHEIFRKGRTWHMEQFGTFSGCFC